MAATTAKKNAKSADGKFADLQKDTAELNDKDHMTTDYGIKISDPDHWLRVASEKNTGPTLLEDQIAREKVRTLPYSILRVQSNN
jgi:catalase